MVEKGPNEGAQTLEAVAGGTARGEVRALYLGACDMDAQEAALLDRFCQQGVRCFSPSRMALPSARADDFAHWRHEHGIKMNEVAVIALCAVDLDAMLGSGIACALEDAGRDCVAAADRVFPSRKAGGLSQALRYLEGCCRDRGDCR